MKNLAGNKEADLYIQEELILAGISLEREGPGNLEVPYTIIGKLGDWTFNRAWYYWVASAPDGMGLPLETAVQMHETPYPIKGQKGHFGHDITHYGIVVRVAGHCGCLPPTDWADRFDKDGKKLVYDPKHEQEEAFKRFIQEGTFQPSVLESYLFVQTKGDLESLTAKALINSYHVDSQLGLNELARRIRS